MALEGRTWNDVDQTMRKTATPTNTGHGEYHSPRASGFTDGEFT